MSGISTPDILNNQNVFPAKNILEKVIYDGVRARFSNLAADRTAGTSVISLSCVDKNPTMFIGHFAAGMAGKKIQPAISLGTLFFAAQFLDLLWPTLLLLGLEKVIIAPGVSAVTPLDFVHYPISHSLAAVLGWGVLFGMIYFLITSNRKGAILLGSLVVSHWVLDLIVHIPDLPLFPGHSPKLGFGLWNSPVLTILVEGAIFITGVILYVRTKKEINPKKRSPGRATCNGCSCIGAGGPIRNDSISISHMTKISL